MATRDEHPDRYGWWLNELESLGISARRTNELNDLKEISSLTKNIKRGLYQQYRLHFLASKKLKTSIKL